MEVNNLAKFFYDTKNEAFTPDKDYTLITEAEYRLIFHFYHSKTLVPSNNYCSRYKICKYKDSGCQSKLLIITIYAHDSETRKYYIKNRHFHDDSVVEEESKRLLPDDAEKYKEVISECLQSHITNFQVILATLEERLKKKITDKRQLTNMIAYMKSKVFTPNRNLTVDRLRIECNKVSSSEISCHVDASPSHYRVYIGFRDRYEHLFKNQPFHIDATFKVLCNDFVILIGGITDACGRLFVTSVLICNSENKDNVDYMLEAMSSEARQQHNKSLDLSCCVSDAGGAILSSLESHFSNTPRKWCFFHMKKALKSKVKCVDTSNKQLKEQIIDILCSIARFPTKETFEFACAMFQSEYQEKLDPISFANIARDILNNPAVSESTCVFAPGTNNCVESLNGKIKTLVTAGRRMDTVQFIRFFIKWHQDTKGDDYFNPKPTYYSTDRELGYHEYKGLINRNKKKYYIFAHTTIDKTAANILDCYIERNFWSLVEMVGFFSKCAVVTSDSKITTFKAVTCTCRAFVKRNVCCHVWYVISSEKRLEVIDLPLEDKKGTKPGRKKILKGGNPLKREE